MTTPISSRKKIVRPALRETASSSSSDGQLKTHEKRQALKKTARQTDLPRMVQKCEAVRTSVIDDEELSDTASFLDGFKTSWSEHTLLSQQEADRIKQSYALPTEQTSSLVSSSTEQPVICKNDQIDTSKPAEIYSDTALLKQMQVQCARPIPRAEAFANDKEDDIKLHLLFDAIEDGDLHRLRTVNLNPPNVGMNYLSTKHDKHTGHTLLTFAVQTGDMSIVSVVCGMGALVFPKNKQGKNAFQVAIDCKNLEIFELLLLKAPNIVNKPALMRDLFFDAIQKNQALMLGHMLHLVLAKIETNDIILKACYKQQQQFRENEIYGHFIEECAPSKEETDLFRQNALSLNKATLLTVGLDLNKALSEAVSCGSDRVIPLLLEYGADLTLGMINSDSFSAEPLSLVWVAASKGHWACVDVLLRNGIALEDVNPMPRGWNGLCEAWKQLHAEVTERQAAMKDADADCANSSADD